MLRKTCAAATEENKTMQQPKFVITVMPDYGFGPYAWQKPASDTSTLVGECIGTAVEGFETIDGTTINASLQSDFANWTAQFEQFAEKPGFDWPAFHCLGLSLSERLKRELGSSYRVSYHKPCEDPEREVNETTEVTSEAPPLDLTATAVRALMLYALAEFQSGHATTIRVTVEGGTFSIADDGRGHPIDKTVEGTSYLKFIYTHFDYPFESGRSAPIQLQGIGMSLVNALCSELALTLRKPDETLQLKFQHGQLCASHRTTVLSAETGITVSAKLSPQLTGTGVDTKQLEVWLLGVAVCHPTLKLFFNGRQLQPP